MVPKMPYLTGEEGVMARMSALAYQSTKRRQLLSDKAWQYQASVSCKEMAAWKNSHTGSVILAFRGTVVNERRDLVSDINQVVARIPTQRFRDCLQAARHAIKVLKTKKVQVTGHSLGGSTAIKVGKTLHLPGIVFNPGTSPLMSTIPASIKVIREEKDAVSASAPGFGYLGPRALNEKTTHNAVLDGKVANTMGRLTTAHYMTNFLSGTFAKKLS